MPIKSNRLSRWTIVLPVIILAALSATWTMADDSQTLPEIEPPTKLKPAFTDDEQKLLDAGQPVRNSHLVKTPTGNAGTGISYLVLPVPIDRAFASITDWDRYAEIYPMVDQSKNYCRTPDLACTSMLVSLLGLLTINYHVLHQIDAENYLVTWALDPEKKSDLLENSGFWKLWPLDEKSCLVAYSIKLESDMSMPGFVLKWLTGTGLERVVNNMKKHLINSEK